jgi:putative flippase GtrA
MSQVAIVTRLWNPKIVRFATVGASGLVVGIGTLYLFTYGFHVNYLVSNIAAFFAGCTNNWIWNTLWTFRHKFSGKVWLKYVVVSSFSWTINEGSLFLLTGVFGVWLLVSSLIAHALAFVFNYYFSRRFVWIKKPETAYTLE